MTQKQLLRFTGQFLVWEIVDNRILNFFERRAKQERRYGNSCIKGVYLDELEPGRGRIDMEVMEDCTIARQLLIT